MLYYRQKGAICMASVISAIKNTVPISLFNRGQAGKIFADVRKSGGKGGMKNKEGECVRLSPGG